MFKIIGRIILLAKKFFQRYLWSKCQKAMMAKCGHKVLIANGCDLTYENLYIGSDVYLGPFTYIIAPFAKVFIGNHIMFGPNVTLIAGNHNTSNRKKYMIDLAEEKPDKYSDINIKDDVWIGANSIILSGVTIGKGAVIGAGSVVAKDVGEFEIWAGNPAKKIKER